MTSILQTQKLLRLPQVLDRFPVSRSTWWAGVKSGKFPQPVKIGPRCTAWRSDDVDLLISEDDMEERRKKWTPPEPKFTRGWLARYAQLVTSAAHGAVLRDMPIE